MTNPLAKGKKIKPQKNKETKTKEKNNPKKAPFYFFKPPTEIPHDA